MAQSTGMAATFDVGTGARRPRSATRRRVAFGLASLLALLTLTLAPLAAAASGNDGAGGLTSDEVVRDADGMRDATARAHQIQKRLRAKQRRALPLLEQAIARDSQSIELLYLSGVADLLAGNHDKAVDALVTVTHREPSFQYGEAYLRAADALIALGRWDDADDALERYVKINSSSIEALYKRLRVCNARKEVDGEQKTKADLRDAWRTLPGCQRRKQLGWYLRSLF